MFKNMFNKEPKKVINEEYKKWRQLVFQLKAGSVEAPSDDPGKVFGVIMDIGMTDRASGSHFWLTTTAFANGDAEFRPTPGGGFSGLGTDARVAAVAKELVSMAQIFKVKAKPVTETPLPEVGRVAFYFLTNGGVLVTEDALSAFQTGPYSQLLNKFGQIRGFAEKLIDQRQGKA